MGSTQEPHGARASASASGSIRHREGARVKFSDIWRTPKLFNRERKLRRNCVTATTLPSTPNSVSHFRETASLLGSSNGLAAESWRPRCRAICAHRRGDGCIIHTCTRGVERLPLFSESYSRVLPGYFSYLFFTTCYMQVYSSTRVPYKECKISIIN